MEKKKMKLGIKILVIILVILCIFLFYTFRKFLIITQIATQEEKDIQSTNYYLKKYSILGGMTELWICNEKSMLKYTLVSDNQLVERTIYRDTKEKETWIINNTSKEKIATKIEYNPNDILIPNAGVHVGFPSSKDIWTLIQLSVISNIKSAEWNGEKVYQVSFNFIDSKDNAIWINKQDYRAIGQMNGTSSDKEGNIYSNILTYSYKFDTLTEEDIKLPDLTDYVIKDSNGNVIEK